MSIKTSHRLMGYPEAEINRLASLPPATPFPLSATDAFELSEWYLRYALDRLADDPACAHAAVKSHGNAALAQHEAVAQGIRLSEAA